MPISPSELEALATFRYALRQFLHFSDEAARAVGLTAQQHQALLSIQGFPGRDQVTISELAERLQIRHHSAVGLVNRLVALQLLKRAAGETDRRQVYVHLTAKGKTLLDKLSRAHHEELKRLGPQLVKLFSQLGV